MQRYNEEGRSSRFPTFPRGEQESTKSAEGRRQTTTLKPGQDVDALMRDEAKKGTIVTAEEFKSHANERSPWFVVNGQVYDGTAFLDKHPGGAESITLVAGEDASEDFMAIHSIDAKKQMREFHVGKLADGVVIAEEQERYRDDADAPFLHAKQWKRSKLVAKTAISHDSYIFRFALDRQDRQVGLPIGQHVYLRVRSTSDDGAEAETVQRAYTPYSGNELRGYLDILIKLYRPCNDYPAGGKMTTALDRLTVGEDYVELKGPLGHFTYEPGSIMRVHKHARRVRNVAMIAGGSGITPIWSTLKGLVEDPEAHETTVWILDANRTEADILARQQIDALIRSAGARIKLWHMLSAEEVPQSWQMGRGRITLDCLQAHLPPVPEPINDRDGHPVEDTIALLCGPPGMEKAVLEGLRTLGWDTERNVVRF